MIQEGAIQVVLGLFVGTIIYVELCSEAVKCSAEDKEPVKFEIKGNPWNQCSSLFLYCILPLETSDKL